MKLIIAIVSNDDSAAVTSTLTEHGYFTTKLSTTGGFSRVKAAEEPKSFRQQLHSM